MVAVVSLFGRQPKSGIIWAAGRGSTARPAHRGRRDHALGFGRGLLGRSCGVAAPLLIGATWSRGVAGGHGRPAGARSAIEVMTTARPKHGWSGAPTSPVRRNALSGAYQRRHWRASCLPGSRLSRPDPSPPTRGPGGDVLGCRERRDAMIAGQAGAGVVVARGAAAQQVCGRDGRLKPAVIAPPDRSWQPSGEGSNPASCYVAVRGRSGAGRVTCGSCTPALTADARQGPGGSGGVRTQRGPGDHDHGPAPVPSVRGRRRRSVLRGQGPDRPSIATPRRPESRHRAVRA
jgi:hypothetical protein